MHTEVKITAKSMIFTLAKSALVFWYAHHLDVKTKMPPYLSIVMNP